MAAALATICVYREQDVVGHLWSQGERLQALINQAIVENRLEGLFELTGRPCNLVFVTRDRTGERSQEFRTLFLQELIRLGIIAPSFVLSFSHTNDDIERTAEAVCAALSIYRKALDNGIGEYLIGRPVKPVDRKYN